MRAYSLSHLSDQTLLSDLAALVARDRVTTAELLAHIAEVDARRLWAPAGYPTMQAYCVDELHLSDDSARKRIHAANVARRVPAILPALADGRLNLSGVTLLAPWLSTENANDLIGAATHKTKSQIEQLIADRFPRLDLPTAVQAIGESPVMTSSEQKCAPGRMDVNSAAHAAGLPPLEPLGAERYALQCTIDKSTHEVLRGIQELLSHRIPSGDLAEVLGYSLRIAHRELQKRKFAATSRPRRSQRSSTNPRHIPADVRRAVHERDQGRCTFVSETGRRCCSRKFLEYDHVEPVARGGKATVENLRLRYRSHNQFAAESAFGTEFMNNKREQARQTAAEKRAKATRERAEADARAKAAATEKARDEVVPWLRQLGVRVTEAREAAKLCETIPHAPLDERVRVALSYFGRRPAAGSSRVSGSNHLVK